MLFILFFKWWYMEGWKEKLLSIGHGAKNIYGAFSVSILLRTMFNPWKQIITKSFADTALEDKIKAGFDNLLSRTIGFFVRIITLLIAAIAAFLNVAIRTAIAVIWPLIPIAPILLVLASFAELVS